MGRGKKKDRRWLRITNKDASHRDFEISKATKLNLELGMLHFDQLKDGTWRITFSEDITNDFSEILSVTIVRQDEH